MFAQHRVAICEDPQLDESHFREPKSVSIGITHDEL